MEAPKKRRGRPAKRKMDTKEEESRESGGEGGGGWLGEGQEGRRKGRRSRKKEENGKEFQDQTDLSPAEATEVAEGSPKEKSGRARSGATAPVESRRKKSKVPQAIAESSMDRSARNEKFVSRSGLTNENM